MKVAAGFAVHTGWAALVVVGSEGDSRGIVERSRIELLDEKDAAWAKAPYHAAEGRAPALAERLVEKSIAAARKMAQVAIEHLAARLRKAGHEVAGCAILVGAPMPEWSVAQILAVHVRMHQAEGVLFQRALADAVAQNAPPLVLVPARQAAAEAVSKEIALLGKAAGPPWGQDQKRAAAAAMRVLDLTGG